MQIAAKTEYACVAVLELALRQPAGRPVRVREIADAHGIPSRFLVQILLQLKGAGIVLSTRGAAGGYRLALDPHQLTLGQVMAVVEGPASELRSNLAVPTTVSRTLLAVWRNVLGSERRMLDEITFAQLVERARSESQDMWYI